MMSGVFISVEGGDGTGKSTQIKVLAEKLRHVGKKVLTTREPGGSSGAEIIRKLLVTGDKDRWSSVTEALLVFAARRDHLEKTILPAMADAKIVITDRFADSSTAYQGIAGGAGEEMIAGLRKLVVGNHEPDLTLILDAPVADGLARADVSKGEGRFEDKGEAFHQSVRDAYLKIAKENLKRCVVIDATGDVEAVAERIEAAIRERLPQLL